MRKKEDRLVIKKDQETKETASVDLTILQRAPKWSRAIFVRQVQPMLVQSCSTTGCHQSGSSEAYHLNRYAIEGSGHPELTLENLAGTLSQIDWKNPTESRLLERAQRSHGSSKESESQSLTHHQLQILRMWIEQLAQANGIREANSLLANVEKENEKTQGTADRQGTVRYDCFDRVPATGSF